MILVSLGRVLESLHFYYHLCAWLSTMCYLLSAIVGCSDVLTSNPFGNWTGVQWPDECTGSGEFSCISVQVGSLIYVIELACFHRRLTNFRSRIFDLSLLYNVSTVRTLFELMKFYRFYLVNWLCSLEESLQLNQDCQIQVWWCVLLHWNLNLKLYFSSKFSSI